MVDSFTVGRQNRSVVSSPLAAMHVVSLARNGPHLDPGGPLLCPRRFANLPHVAPLATADHSQSEPRRARLRFRRGPATGAERKRRDAFGAEWGRYNSEQAKKLRGGRG